MMALALEALARSEGWREEWIEGWREGWMEGWHEGWNEGWHEGWIEGRIHGTIEAARRHGLNDDVIISALIQDCGLSQEEALNEIWKYDHPQVQGQSSASDL